MSSVPVAGFTAVLVLLLGCNGSVIVTEKCGGKLGRVAWQTVYDTFEAVDGSDYHSHHHDPVAIAATSGDGAPDLFVGSRNTGTMLGYKGLNNGFASTPSWSIGSYQDLGCIAKGDVNGDGLADLALCGVDTVEGSRSPAVYFGSNAGLTTVPSMVLAGHEAARSVSFADVDCDGKDDLVLGGRSPGPPDPNENGPPMAEVFKWTASGSFQRMSVVSVPGLALRPGPPVVPVGDVNGDGCADLMLLSRDSVANAVAQVGLSLFLGNRAGLSTTPTWFAGQGVNGFWSPWNVVSLGDVDSDGFDDIFILAQDQWPSPDLRYLVFRGDSQGLATGAAWSAPEWGPADRLDTLTVADFNGDGRRDIVLGNHLYLGPKHGPPGPFSGSLPGFELGEHQLVGATADVNRDGCDDFVVADSAATLYLGGLPAGQE